MVKHKRILTKTSFKRELSEKVFNGMMRLRIRYPNESNTVDQELQNIIDYRWGLIQSSITYNLERAAEKIEEYINKERGCKNVEYNK